MRLNPWILQERHPFYHYLSYNYIPLPDMVLLVLLIDRRIERFMEERRGLLLLELLLRGKAGG